MSILKKLMICITFCFTIFSFDCHAMNNSPIILVHGFTGWGRDEMLGFLYWGGVHDLQEELKSNGNRVYTASVGPLNSNYERAVELFAQIKGTCTDYGELHSKKYGHARFGRCYTKPLYSQWNENNKIHLIGHSQGGQTIRALLTLLKEGSPEEVFNNKNDVNDLFRGNKNWVTSITTVATPNNGTTLTNILDAFIPTIQSIFSYFGAVAGLGKGFLYDLKVEHWGLVKNKNETISEYMNRVLNSKIFNTKDMSKWDLSPEGARDNNAKEKTYSDIYYFTFSTQSTTMTNPFNQCKFSFLNLLDFPSGAIGCYTQNDPNKVIIDSKWLANDGIVNTYSMQAPFNAKSISFNGNPQIGIWNDMGVKSGWNHIDIIAALPNLFIPYSNVKKLYENHLELIHQL
jgi:triacylglycerol lipase